MTYMEKLGPSIVIRRAVNGNYPVIKDTTGALGSRVAPSTALALRNELGPKQVWILPDTGSGTGSDPDAPRVA